MADFNDPSDFTTASGVVTPTKPYRAHAKVAWILMIIVAVIALVPFLGFASWFIAGPMLLVSFIMIVLVFAKGGVAHGLALLACQILVMPLIVIFGPFISSALGLVGAAAGAGAAIESSSDAADSYPSEYEPNIPAGDTGSRAPTIPDEVGRQPFDLPDDLEALRAKILEQQHSVTEWVRSGLAVETPSGFLKSGDTADVEVRRSVQQQNLWREQAFGRIADLTGQSPEEVAQAYARMASGQ